MNWNFDMSQAPRGRVDVSFRKVGDDQRRVEAFIPERILAAAKDGKVCSSYWIPPRLTTLGAVLDGERWSGFNRGEEPEAWLPWPLHPRADPVRP